VCACYVCICNTYFRWLMRVKQEIWEETEITNKEEVYLCLLCVHVCVCMCLLCFRVFVGLCVCVSVCVPQYWLHEKENISGVAGAEKVCRGECVFVCYLC
jgi:hypothetical protein